MQDPAAKRPLILTDCLKTIGLDGTLRAMDVDSLCLMEIDDFQTVAGQPWSALWPTESQHIVEESIARAAGGKVARFNADCPTAKGTMKSWEVLVTPVRDDAGVIVALQSVSHDVSDREHSHRESVLVSRELSHRIKNLFAVIDSVISLSARSEPSARPFFETLRDRLSGLSRAISFINPTEEDDLNTSPRTVKGLIEALLAPYRLAGANITVTGDDMVIGKGSVTSLSLVLNEMATNAIKYGAIKDAAGRLSINVSNATDNLIIEWVESGVPVALGDNTKPGFGTMLLDRMMSNQLSGTLDREWRDDGLRMRLSIPTTRLA